MAWRRSKSDFIQGLFTLTLERARWREGEVAFMYLGYSGIILRMMMGRTIAFDVADLLKSEEISALQNLSVLLFTRGHEDHYKLKEALDIYKATGAQIVAEPSVANDLRGKVPSDKLVSAEPGGTYGIGDIKVTAVSGVHRVPINLYHVKVGELNILHCGDSGYVSLKEYPADLAFLPTGGPSPTASPEAALKMALDVRPKVAVAIRGSGGQSRKFEKGVKRQMPETTVIIPERYKPKKVTL
jgi:L-ascorbate metabolism protein UlaG (beta-lactamase superfamily)